MNTQMDHYANKLKYELDSSDLFQQVNDGEKIIIIDARKEEAYTKSHIPNVINLYHNDMTSKSTKEYNKSYTYVTYCDGIGCNASTKGALKMLELGFIVKELLGGLDWWIRDGYETKGSEGQAGNNISCAC